MDSIFLNQLELWTPIGVPESERRAPQRILASIELFLDLKKAGKNDTVEQSVDYALVAQRIGALAETPRKTVECLCEDIANVILQEFHVKTVKVTVEKFPPIGTKSVLLTIERP